MGRLGSLIRVRAECSRKCDLDEHPLWIPLVLNIMAVSIRGGVNSLSFRISKISVTEKRCVR